MFTYNNNETLLVFSRLHVLALFRTPSYSKNPSYLEQKEKKTDIDLMDIIEDVVDIERNILELKEILIIKVQ